MDQVQLRQQAITEVIEREGGDTFTNRSADRGGPTRYGVTQATARQYGYSGDMAALPFDVAFNIFRAIWDSCHCDEIAEHSHDLAIYVFDFAVNSGSGNAGNRLQRLLNVLNNRGKLYPDITVDGAIGAQTIASLTAFAKIRGEAGLHLLSEAFNALRIYLCFSLAEKQESQEENITGWFNRICEL